MHFVTLFVVAFLLSACTQRYADFFPYHDNGTKKPFVTLLPTYNANQSKGSEEISQSLTKQVRNRLKRNGKIFCPPEELANKVLQTIPIEELVRANEMELFKKFPNTDYICTIELAEYKIVPYKRNKISPLYLADLPADAADVLMLAARLNIVDIRSSVPKFVRQEIVQSNHMIAKNPEIQNISMIRSRLARDLAEKIEKAVCVKK